MRKYETFFIVDPDLPDETAANLDDKLQAIVSSNGGTVVSYVPWGKKRLAYPVKKHSRGSYILMEFGGGAQLVAELERNMRLDERVLKFITVKQQDFFDPTQEPAPVIEEEPASEETGAATEGAEAESSGETEQESVAEPAATTEDSE